MARRKYIVRFRITGGGNEMHIWERFATDWASAVGSVNKALKREYPKGYNLVSVLRAWND